jgi:hypothetical protein
MVERGFDLLTRAPSDYYLRKHLHTSTVLLWAEIFWCWTHLAMSRLSNTRRFQVGPNFAAVYSHNSYRYFAILPAHY